jgi:hypothetical protein
MKKELMLQSNGSRRTVCAKRAKYPKIKGTL